MDLGTLHVKIAGDAKNLKTTLTTTKKDLKGFTAGVNKFAKENEEALRNVGLAFAAIGAAGAAALVISTKRFAEFEQGMKNVQAVSRATEPELRALTEAAKQIGIETALSATQATQAFFSLASAGLTVEEQIGSINAVTTLALATQSDLNQSTELITKSMRAFGLSAEDTGHIADVMTNSIQNSLATMDRLTTALPFAATTFQRFGFSVEDAAGALSILLNNGLEASQAGTGLRRMLVSLANPTKEATDTLMKYGIALETVTPETNELVDIVGVLAAANITASDSFKIFGQRSEAAAILMKEGADELEDMIGKMGKAGTAVATMEQQMDSLSGSLTIMKSSLEAVQIIIGDAVAPALRVVADQMTDTLNAFNNAPPILQKVGVGFGALFTGLTAVTGVGLILLSQLPKIIVGFKALAELQILLKLGGLAAALTPVGIAIGAAGGLIGLAALAINEFKEARKDVFFEQEFKSVQKDIEGIAKSIVDWTASIDILEAKMEELRKSGVDPLAYSLNITALGVENMSSDVRKVPELLKTMNDMLRQSKIDLLLAQGATKEYAIAAVDAAKASEMVKEKTAENAEVNKAVAKTWEEVSATFGDWVSITGAGYKASLVDRVAFLDNLLKSVDKESKAFIGLSNQRQDLLDEINEAEKKATAKTLAEYTRAQEGFLNTTAALKKDVKKRSTIFKDGTDFTFDVESKAATDRINLAADITGKLETINEEFNQKTADNIAQNQQLIKDLGDKHRTEEETAVLESSEKVLKIQTDANLALLEDVSETGLQRLRMINQFRAQQLNSFDAERALLNDHLMSKTLLYQAAGQDVSELEKFKAAELRKIRNAEWQHYADTVADGAINIADSYLGIRSVFATLSGDEAVFHDTWLTSMADWIDDQAVLLNNLLTLWTNVSTIIAKVAGLFGGGGGAGVAETAAGAAISNVGTLGKASGAIGGGTATAAGAVGTGGAISGGAATAAGAVGTGVSAGLAFLAPILPLLGPVAAAAGAALLINKFSGRPGSENERTAEQRARAAEAESNRALRDFRAKEKERIRQEQQANIESFLTQKAATPGIRPAGLTGGANFIADLFVGSEPRQATGGAFGGAFGGGVSTVGIESRIDKTNTTLSSILSTLSSGSSSFGLASKGARGFDSELVSVAKSLGLASDETFRLSDELAGNTLTDALALSTEETEKLSDALKIEGKELANTKKQIELITLAEKKRADLISKNLAIEKQQLALVSGGLTAEKKRLNLQQEAEEKAVIGRNKEQLLILANRQQNAAAEAKLIAIKAQEQKEEAAKVKVQLDQAKIVSTLALANQRDTKTRLLEQESRLDRIQQDFENRLKKESELTKNIATQSKAEASAVAALALANQRNTKTQLLQSAAIQDRRQQVFENELKQQKNDASIASTRALENQRDVKAALEKQEVAAQAAAALGLANLRNMQATILVRQQAADERSDMRVDRSDQILLSVDRKLDALDGILTVLQDDENTIVVQVASPFGTQNELLELTNNVTRIQREQGVL